VIDLARVRALIARSCERHGRGGRRAARIAFECRSLDGLLLRAKGLRQTFPQPRRGTIEPLAARATFPDFPRAGAVARFEAGLVSIDGAPRAHRASFDGLAKWRRWRPLDAVYFFGYALTHYHALPWSLADAEPIALAEAPGGAAALTVRFPASVHTHCPVQTFHFDASGLIVRHDYTADIVGGFARGSHFWRRYVEVDGIAIATHRRVVARLGPWLSPIVALEARFARPEVVLA
jgi:hypothetical protein